MGNIKIKEITVKMGLCKWEMITGISLLRGITPLSHSLKVASRTFSQERSIAVACTVVFWGGKVMFRIYGVDPGKAQDDFGNSKIFH